MKSRPFGANDVGNRTYRMRIFKFALLYAAKFSGFFYLARKLTANGLRILCYHGFSYDDEHLFRPKLFMSKATFMRRLEMIERYKFSVIGLTEAIDKLRSADLPTNSLVITMDDGWKGTMDIARPLLKQFGYPWTLYLTTYYVKNNIQVLNLAIQYLFWKTKKKNVDLSGINEKFDQVYDLSNEGEGLSRAVYQYIDDIDDLRERVRIVDKLAGLLDVDIDNLKDRGLFYLINPDSCTSLYHSGVDIQLHTHRHTLGVGGSRDRLHEELMDNKAAIVAYCDGHIPKHFCYPSGYYESSHLDWLHDEGIVSATTCVPGMNYAKEDPLQLKRFLDGENISEIEFEAELTGFLEIGRKFKTFATHFRKD